MSVVESSKQGEFMFKILLLLVSSIYLQAATFEVIGPCAEKPLFSTTVEISETNVGDATVKILTDNGIEFQGSRVGMKSIFNTPTGLDAMEIISDFEMNAHGWCYAINGVEPNVYPDEVKLTNKDHVTWWYGFAHYYKGKWLSMCEPTWQRAPEQFCN